MSTLTLENPLHGTHDQRKMWTREEAARLKDLFPDQRLELIEGDLINKMGQKPPHAYVLMVLTQVFSQAFPGRVRVQSAITLPDPEGIRSEPEPDVVILHQASADFFHRHPGPPDIALLIEVSDTSLSMDRETKARLYARCGIEMYWIVDIQRRRVLVLLHPSGEEYNSITTYEGNESVSFQGTFILVESLFQ
jgi:Uma2 family endonuclease